MLLARAGHAETEARALTGGLDVRPSWTASAGTIHAENELSAALTVQPDLSFGYVQAFQAGLSGGAEPAGFEAGDGYLKAQIRLGDSFELEPRLVFPTNGTERDNGFRAAVRPILKALFGDPSGLGFEIWESPIVSFYDRPGYGDSDTLTANRVFENRIDLVGKYALWGERLALRFPLILQQVRYRAFVASARNHEAWESLVSINPEAVFALTETIGLGLAYYSQNLIGGEGTFWQGLKDGVTQVVFQQTF